jgi:hypothetical protein
VLGAFLVRLTAEGGGGRRLAAPAFEVCAGLEDHSRLQLESRTCRGASHSVPLVSVMCNYTSLQLKTRCRGLC